MRRLTRVLTGLVTTALVTAGLMVVAAPAAQAAAHAAPWRWKTVTGTPQAVPGGTQGDVMLYCPAGYRPVSLEWHLDSTYSTNSPYQLIRQAEYVDYSGNWGRLLFYNPNTVTRTVYASLNCVHGDDVGTISVVGKDFSAATHGGFVACPSLTSTMIGGGADWGSYENGRSIDYSAPTTSGWFANGHGGAGIFHVEVYCIALGYQTGMHLVQHQEGAYFTSVSCSTNERVVSGGGYAYPVGGSVNPSASMGRLLSVDQQQYPPKVDIAATTPGSGSTWLVAWALCAPVSTPSLTIYQAPSGDQSSTSIGYSFAAGDPAGEDLLIVCSLSGYGSAIPCTPSSLNTVSGLADGSYTLQILLRNDSEQVTTQFFSFRVDTTAPTITTSGKPANPTSSTSAAFTVTANDTGSGVAQVTCRLDAESEHTCPDPAAYSGLADGLHTFRMRAVDMLGNERTGSYTWRVDTVAPSAALTSPPTPFTQTRSALVQWTGSDAGSGITSWQVQWERAPYNGDFGAWSSPATYAAGTLSHTFTGLAPGYDYCYRVRSVDKAGNTSVYSPRRCTAMLLDDRALTASTGWSRITGGGYYAGTATSGQTLNATLQRTGAQLDRLALLATTCPTCGTVGVYVDGVLIRQVSLTSSTTNPSQLISISRFSYRTGSVRLKVLSTGKPVTIDGLGISRT